jgi:hypothetical protein
VDVNWDQLYNVLWLLIVFVAPGIIGLFKKDKNEEEEPARKENRGFDIDSIIGGRGVEFDKLKQQSRAQDNESIDEELKDKVKEVNKKQPERKLKPAFKPKLEKPRRERIVDPAFLESQPSQPVSVVVEKEKPKRRESLYRSRLTEQSALEPILNQSDSSINIKKPKSKNKLRELIIWREILGPPKALDRSF